MKTIIIAAAFLVICYIWSKFSGRKLDARIERISKVHGPDARIGYMTRRGKRFTWQITIESVKPKGRDWIITAWCHEENEFLIFQASRMYEYFDFNRYQEITNVPAYFTERYGRRFRRKSV